MIVVESALFFSVFGTLLGRRFQRISRGKKQKKLKMPFPCFLSPLSSFPSFHVFRFSCFLSFFLSFFLSLFLSLSFFHYFISLSFFFFSPFILSLSGPKNSPKSPKLSKITKNAKNHQKSPRSPKIPENPIKIGVPKITFAKITKYCKNKVEKILGTQHAR